MKIKAAENGCPSKEHLLFKTLFFLSAVGLQAKGETTFWSFRGRPTPKTVAKRKFFEARRATLSSWLSDVNNCSEAQILNFAAHPFHRVVVVGRPDLS